MNLITAYIEMGEVKAAADHKTVGYTSDSIKRIIELLSSPNFLYTRAKNYGIAVIHRDNTSPTGVLNVGGIPYELEWMIAKFQKNGSPLSPTEDLRTAH